MFSITSRLAVTARRLGQGLLTVSHPFSTASAERKTVLVVGSSGALGSVVAKHLSSSRDMTVVGADVMEIPSAFTGDWELDGFITLPRTGDLTELTLQLVRGVNYFLSGTRKQKDDEDDVVSTRRVGLDAIIVASGGWSPDPQEASGTGEKAVEQNAIQYCSTIEDMRRKNLDPCLASGYIAQQFMNPSGLMVVMGATAALQPTPGMVGYGLAKTAAHFYVQTLGSMTGQSLDNKSIRKSGAQARQGNFLLESLSVVGILPTTIDTAANRRAFPHGDYNEWVRPLDIATEIATWIEEPVLRPHSGSLVKVRPAEQSQGALFELAR